MIQHLTIHGRTERVASLAPGLGAALERTSILDGSPTVARDPDGRWAGAWIEAPDPVCGERWQQQGSELLVLNGPALGLSGSQANVVREAHRAFRTAGTAGVAGIVGGIFHAVGVTGGELRAFGDLSGLAPVYWASDHGVTAVSNRASAVAAVLGLRGWDHQAMSWLIASSGLRGAELPHRGVRYVGPGTELRIDPDGTATLGRSPSWVWPSPDDDSDVDDLAPAEWDAVTDALIEGFRPLGALGEPVKLFLTGGKDSRLCLALAKAAGLAPVTTTVTTGAGDGPEAIHARLVAEAAGFVHQVHQPLGAAVPGGARPEASDPGATAKPSTIQTDRAEFRWTLLRRHLYRHEVTVATWDGMVDAGGSALDIKGIGGEFFRRSSSPWLRDQETASVEDFTRHLLRLGTANALGLLRADRNQANDAIRRYTAHNGAVVRADLLTEKHYVDFVLGHHNGTIFQNRPATTKLAPLVQVRAIKPYLALSGRARAAERLHYEVMRRTAPELVELPFYRDRWSTDIAGAPNPEPIAVPETVAAPATPAHNRRSWRWNFVTSEHAEISALFAEAGGSGLDEICDVDRLRALVSRPDELTRPAQVKPLFAAIGVSLALLGRTERVVDQP